MQKPNQRTLLYLSAVLLCLCAAAGILWAKTTRPQAAEAPVARVRTMVVSAASKENAYTYSGEVRGRFESQLAFQVTGKITARCVDIGSPVSRGDLLMQLDSRDLQQAANVSSAQGYSAQSQLRLAESNLQRYRQLYDEAAVSRAQYDQYVNAYDAAVAAVRQTAAQSAQDANKLDYSRLCADVDGVVSSVSAEAGQVVSAGQAVVTVVRNGEQEIEIHVPENRLGELRQAQHIKISFWALPGLVLDGAVREVAPMADKVSRTYKVRIALQEQPPDVKLGMTAAVELAREAAGSALSIPLTAICQTGASPAVWVVTDGTVHLQPIKTAAFGDDSIQVVEGLQPGDIIVTAGVHKLREGQQVAASGDGL